MFDEMFAFDVPTFVDIEEVAAKRATHATLQYGIDRMNIFDAWFTYPHVLHERDNHSAYSLVEKRGSKTKKSKKTFQVAAAHQMDVVRKSLSERLSLNRVRSVFKKRRRETEELEEDRETDAKRLRREAAKRPSLAQDSHTFGFRKTADCSMSSNPFLRKSHSGLKFFPPLGQPPAPGPASSFFRLSNRAPDPEQALRQPPLLTADKPAQPPKERRSEYVPQVYPFKIIKKWEAATGKLWHTLSMDERRAANKEMGLMK